MKKTLYNIDTIVSCVALVVVIASVSLGVFMRYIFGVSLVWTNELAGVAFTWVVFMGASVAFKKRMHIGIDLLVKKAPSKIRFIIELVAHVLVFVFIVYMIIYGTIFSIESHEQPTSVLRIPNTYFYMAVPASFALMLVCSFRTLAQLMKPSHK